MQYGGYKMAAGIAGGEEEQIEGSGQKEERNPGKRAGGEGHSGQHAVQ